MALPTFWNLIVPELSATTVMGIVFLAIGIFGSALLRLIGKIISKITGGKVKEGVLVSLFLVTGIVLIWGISIFHKLIQSKEFLLILGGTMFFIAFVIFAVNTREEGGVF